MVQNTIVKNFSSIDKLYSFESLDYLSPEPMLSDWLTTSDSIWDKLLENGLSPRIQIINEGYQDNCYEWERDTISMQFVKKYWIRTVRIHAHSFDKEMEMFARCVIPDRTIIEFPELQDLGEMNLGKVLFGKKYNFVRKKFKLYKQNNDIGRVSWFQSGVNGLLLTEFFSKVFQL